VLIKRLGGARFVRREPSDPALRVYLFSKEGREIRVAWSTEGAGIYELRGAFQQIDMMGNAKPISSQNGAVSLDTNPVYLESAASN